MSTCVYPWYLLTNPCCTNDPCTNPRSDITKQSGYLIYTGPNLPCSGIDTNDTLTVCIQKIEEFLCSLTTTTTTTTI